MKREASDSERRELVEAWRQAEVRGETQANFCAAHEFSPRTLRSWLAQYPPCTSSMDLAAVLAALQDCLQRLKELASAISEQLQASAPEPDSPSIRTCPPPPAAAAAAEEAVTSPCASPLSSAAGQPNGRRESTAKPNRTFSWDD